MSKTSVVESGDTEHSTCIRWLDVMVEANIPAFEWGEPGLGKTAHTEKHFSDRGYNVVSLIGATMEPTEIGGLPTLIERGEGVMQTKYALQEWFHDAVEKDAEGIPTLLFLDEFNLCPHETEAAFMYLVQSRILHGNKLPNSTRIVAAGNPPSDIMETRELPPAMASRFAHKDWAGASDRELDEGERKGWPTAPPEWSDTDNRQSNYLAWNQVCRAFKANNPALRNDLSPSMADELYGKIAMEGRGWPCNRSWTNLARALAVLGGPRDIQDERDWDFLSVITESLLGTAPTVPFYTYAKSLDLPDPQTWLDDPSLAAKKHRGDKLAVMVHAVACLATSSEGQKDYKAKWDQGVAVMGAIAGAHSAGTAAPGMLELADHIPKRASGEAAALSKSSEQVMLEHFADLIDLADVS